MVKVVMVSTYDYEGGAARAAHRLHNAFQKHSELESVMLVQKKQTNDVSVMGPDTRIGKLIALAKPHIDQLPLWLHKKNTSNLISMEWFTTMDLLNKINHLKPDVVNLHWICKGHLSLSDIGRIKAPVVWTMHDYWPFTGGCHLTDGCEKFESTCKNCPQISTSIVSDPVKWCFNQKEKLFNKKQIQFVAVSSWLKNVAQKSHLLRHQSINVIHNPLDINRFNPLNKSYCRHILGVGGKKIIAFGAMSALDDKNKGFVELVDALKYLSPDVYELIVFGHCADDQITTTGHAVKYLGNIHDELLMNVIYSSADVVVVPSRIESFGQTASEALACGTPVVAFNTSGLIDIVDHKINGYLATCYDTKDLAKGIAWVVSNDSYEELSNAARKKAVANFDDMIVVNKYLALFKTLR